MNEWKKLPSIKESAEDVKIFTKQKILNQFYQQQQSILQNIFGPM